VIKLTKCLFIRSLTLNDGTLQVRGVNGKSVLFYLFISLELSLKEAYDLNLQRARNLTQGDKP